MNNYFDCPMIYVSHAILGTTGDMEGNCKKAIKAIRKVRKLFPEVDFYLPAESDLVLQILYKAKKLSVNNILWADVKILQECHGWCFYKFEESSGSEIERKEAIRCRFIKDTEHDIVYDISRASYCVIRDTFNPIVKKTIQRFRS